MQGFDTSSQANAAWMEHQILDHVKQALRVTLDWKVPSRLRHLIQTVLVAPRKRVKTRPSRSSVERRLQEKLHRSQRKQHRRFRSDDEN